MHGYFESLCDVVGIGKNRGDQPYVRLAEWLMDQEFLALMAGDRNRAYEGIEAREGYSDAPHGPCRVFEMLVGLCSRMVFMAEGIVPKEENREGYWFYLMITNLGLSSLTDGWWNLHQGDAEEIAFSRVDRWMNREFEYDGAGGLFPLKDPKNDQTQVEIWYQMNNYLMEKLGDAG